jgi:hypothetical protein
MGEGVAGVVTRVQPIAPADVPRVAEFLHQELNRRVPTEAWARALQVPWSTEQPNHGFMLLSDGEVAGAHLAFYSERVIDGQVEKFCNLGAWCVREGLRFHGMRLLTSLLAQPGYTFTDLSPSGSVVPLNVRLKFEFLDTATALVPNLPWPSVPGRFRVHSDRASIEAALNGEQRQIYRDHAAAAAARHLVIQRGGRTCYVIFRKDRRKNLPVFATILHVSDPDLFAAAAGVVARRMLLRHGALASLIEQRVVPRRGRLSAVLAPGRRKMFKSSHLKPDQIDYLYSELVCVAW